MNELNLSNPTFLHHIRELHFNRQINMLSASLILPMENYRQASFKQAVIIFTYHGVLDRCQVWNIMLTREKDSFFTSFQCIQSYYSKHRGKNIKIDFKRLYNHE